MEVMKLWNLLHVSIRNDQFGFRFFFFKSSF